jgi:hypothetical protein
VLRPKEKKDDGEWRKMRGDAGRVCRLDMYKQGWVFCLLSTFEGQAAWTDIGLGWSYPKVESYAYFHTRCSGNRETSYLPNY